MYASMMNPFLTGKLMISEEILFSKEDHTDNIKEQEKSNWRGRNASRKAAYLGKHDA